MSDYSILRADDAPDYTGDGPGAFYGYAGPLGAEELGLNIRVLEPGQANVPPGTDENTGHRHIGVEEIYVVLSGELTLKLDDQIEKLEPRDAVRVPAEVGRAMRNDGTTETAVLMVSRKMSDPRGQSEFIPDFW